MLPTPIKLAVLRRLLAGYGNAVDKVILIEGFTEGFSLGYTGLRVCMDSECLRSASAQPNIVHGKLAKEIQAGRIAGPFVSRPLQQLQCSPIGIVPKKEPGSFRLIHHLSFPHGGAINDFIDKEQCKVKYASFDVAVQLVVQSGKGAWRAKSDIKSAFRLLPVSPGDYELLGFTFANHFYFDKCLPMGCSISCALFEKFSTFLEFRVQQMARVGHVTHYLDDFLFIAPTKGACQERLSNFTAACGELGVPIAGEKRKVQRRCFHTWGLSLTRCPARLKFRLTKSAKLLGRLKGYLVKLKPP